MSRIIIRPAEPTDAQALQVIYAPFVTDTNLTFELAVPTLEECVRRITSTLERYPFLACEEDGVFLGYCSAGPHNQRGGYRFDVNVSVYVAPEHHSRRIGSALYTALFAILKEQGYYNAYAGISGRNKASLGLHLATGFSTVGTFHNACYKRGRWDDLVWMEKSLREHDTPAPTKAFGEISPLFLQSVFEDCAKIVRTESAK